MNNLSGIMQFSSGIVALIVMAAFIYFVLEKRKKKNVARRFREFSKNHKVTGKNLRAVPRVTVPDSLPVILTLTEEKYFGLKADVLDFSLSGFAVRPDFPLRRLPLDAVIKNVLVITPINTFVIKEMKTIRIHDQIENRLMAFHIEDVEEDQFEKLQQFMTYLDEFLRIKDEEETG